ncbi:MAG: ATP-binding protein [Nanoarchaeota archaeon]|nr:ATP-binding protein [Nanoarchaeota archaeon]
MKKFVVTGGPSVGKTSTLEELINRGYCVVPEASRRIITAEQEKERTIAHYSPIVPWTNVKLFQEYVLEEQNRLEAEVDQEIVFLDRGKIDLLGYAAHFKIILDDTLRANILAADYEKVFLLDPLPQYENDTARKESREEGLQIHHAIAEAYKSHHFTVISVPVMSIADRADFIEYYSTITSQNKKR